MKLRPYQRQGVRFLCAHPHAYLADSMRLGKTVQAVVAARWLQLHKVLVVAPASALENWRRHWRELGTPGTQAEVVSYNRLALHGGTGKGYQLVVLDEAHYAKSAGARRTKVALRVAAEAERAWLLSGTPMPNNPGELYTVVRALWPHLFRQLGLRADATHWEWFDFFCNWRPTLNGPAVTGIRHGKELRRALRGVMLRRRLADVAPELPPVQVDVSLLPPDRQFENELGKFGDARELEELFSEDERGAVSQLRRFLGEYKAPLVAAQLIEELRQQQYAKLVVFAHHHSVLDTLQAAFEKVRGLEVVGFRGGTPERQRVAAIDDFARGPAQVFLAQQSAAGIAVDLSAATEIVLVEPSWSPEDNAQAVARVQSISNPLPRRARLFAVPNTLDDALLGVLARKTQMIAEGLPLCPQ